MRRHTSRLAALALAAGVLSLTASPAQAATATVTDLATSLGHVTANVSTPDAAVLKVYATVNGEIGASSDAVTIWDTSAGTVPVDLTTWGLDTGVLVVETCESDESGCTTAATESFTAVDAEPAVTWEADAGTTVTDPSYDVAASDPDGGGFLFVSGTDLPAELLRRNGTPTTLTLAEGTESLTVHRCADLNASVCRGIAPTHGVTYDAPFTSTAALSAPWPDQIDVDATPSLQLTVTLAGTVVRDESHDYGIFREIRDADGVVQGMGVGQIFDHASDGDHHYTVGLTHLTTGQYTLRVETAWGPDPEDRKIEEFPLDVVNPAPPVASFNRSLATIYPWADGYQDAIRFRLRPQTWVESDTSSVQIRNAAGTLVRTLDPQTDSEAEGYFSVWDGRSDAGHAVSAGSYTVTGLLTDRAGTTTTTEPLTVDVVRKHIVKKSFSKSVTPAASYAKEFVGRCSVVRRPSQRGWTGSFGLYSNRTCSSGYDASLAETHHGMFVPKAFRYGDFSVTVYGGAASAKPASTLTLAYLGSQDTWAYRSTLGSGVGNHAGRTTSGTWAVHDKAADPWVYWANYVSKGRRYDVKSYTVRLKYDLLVND